jgi:hypothetical protein
MKTLFFIFCFAITHLLNANAQKASDLSCKPWSLYFGGMLSGIGYYYFKSNSSFIFLRRGLTVDNKKEAFKDRFNDTIVGFGKGEWFLKDSFLIVKFDSQPDENIFQGKLRYSTSSKKPYDSFFLKVNVTNYDKKTLNIASVKLFDKYIGNPAGATGYRQITLPLKYNKHELVIHKPGYIEQRIKLQPGYNVHEITITLSANTDSVIDVLSKVEFPYKFHCDNNSLMFDGKLKKQNEGKEKLISLVMNSYKKFPIQRAFLNMILGELKNE